MTMCSEEDKTMWKGKKDIKEMLAWLYDQENVYENLEHTLITSEKSEQSSVTLREEGSGYYRKKDFEKALEYYNLSIMAAPHSMLSDDSGSCFSDTVNEDETFKFPLIEPARYGGVAKGESVALAKGFANRSAIMFELKLYENCLQDIELAIECGYPKELSSKLESRKKRCIAAQEQDSEKSEESESKPQTPNRSEKSEDELESLVSSESKPQTPNRSEKSEDELESLVSKCSELMKPESSPEANSLEHRISKKPSKPPLLAVPSSVIPSLSNALKVSYKPLKGRTVVATRDIPPGEVLGVDRAFSVALAEPKLTTHCSTCACLCLTPLPCPGCSKVIFCSKLCRTRGLAEDHWLDCKIMPSVFALEKNNWICSYKLFRTYSCRQLLDMVKQLDNEKHDNPENVGFNSKGIYSSTAYNSVHHLHHDMDVFSEENLLEVCRESFTIVKILEQSERYYINDLGEPAAPSREDILGTCEALLLNLARKRINSFSLKDQEDCDFVLFPAFSLVNHSCTSSCDMVSFGRESALVSTTPISAGEEVTIGYVSFHKMENSMRKMVIKTTYGFVCKCKACEDGWPTYAYLPQYVFKCSNCQRPQQSPDTTICRQCTGRQKKGKHSAMRKQNNRMKQKILDAIAEVEGIKENLMMEKNYSAADFQRICDISELLNHHLAMPCGILIMVKIIIGTFATEGYFKNQ